MEFNFFGWIEGGEEEWVGDEALLSCFFQRHCSFISIIFSFFSFYFNKWWDGFFIFLIKNYTRGTPIGATYALTQSKLTWGAELLLFLLGGQNRNFVILRGPKMHLSQRKNNIFIYIFYWFGRTRSFAYVPVRDQNLVIRGRNWRLIDFVFFINFEKSLKQKSSGKYELVCIF